MTDNFRLVLVFFISVAGSFLGCVILLGLGYFIGRRSFRTIIQKLFGLVLNRLLTDKYPENLMELWGAVKRTSVQHILEMSLRAEHGEVIGRPIGSPKHFVHYDNLMFVPAQMARLPVEDNVPVDMKVSIGPKADKPVTLSIPLMISGMGYGVALSEEAKLALAKAAKQLGTCLNSGEGPYLQEERQAAGIYAWQIGRGPWGFNPEAIAASDLIEVQMGQGARVGTHSLKPHAIKGKCRQLMGLSPVESAVSKSVTPGIKNPWDWPKYISELRQMAGGKPVGVKIMAGGQLERDLAVLVEAGVDFITLDGAQGGTHASSPIMQDDFGLPSLNALVRAERYLREQGVRKEITLIVAGGYFTPGECLKALALGADAVNLGTVPLFALVHRQIEKILPWEPLTQLLFYDSPYKNRLDINLAAQSVVNVFQSMVKEMEEGIKALGKKSLAEIGPNDLVALDRITAEITGVKLA